MLHVGDDRRQQVRDAVVDREFEHLRIDQDQPHLSRLRLVQQRQDHRVDRDRFAGSGRARNQQMRHAREVGNRRVARDILAERKRQHARRIVVRRGRENFDELDDLPARIGKLERHARFAGNRLDDANRHDRQRACQVLHQVDDLRALDADGRFDFITGDHRAGICRQHLGRNAEVGQLALDQPRREIERFGADRLGGRRCVLEQRQRRQRRVGHVGEKRPLLLARHALRFRDGGHRGKNDKRFARCRVFAHVLDRQFPFRDMRIADAAIQCFLATPARARDQRLDTRADPLHHAQPRNAEKKRRSDGEQREQQERCAVEADAACEVLPDRITERAAGCERQCGGQAPKSNGFECGARQQHQRETHGAQRERMIACVLRMHDAAVACDHQHDAANDPPPCREPEQVKQQVGDPRPDHAATVGNRFAESRTRPARIRCRIGDQDQREV